MYFIIHIIIKNIVIQKSIIIYSSFLKYKKIFLKRTKKLIHMINN